MDDKSPTTDVSNIAAAFTKVSLNEKTNTLDLELNTPPDWNQIRSEIVQGWNTSKKVPQIKLVECSTSDNGKNI